MDAATVKRWFNGKQRPLVPNLPSLARALECTVEELTNTEDSQETAKPDPISSGEAEKGGLTTATLIATEEIEGDIEIDEPIETWSEDKQTLLLDAIAKILKLGGSIRITGKPREGSVKLPVKLTREEWEKLEKALTEGKLAHLKVIGIQRHDAPKVEPSPFQPGKIGEGKLLEMVDEARKEEIAGLLPPSRYWDERYSNLFTKQEIKIYRNLLNRVSFEKAATMFQVTVQEVESIFLGSGPMRGIDCNIG